VAAVEGEPELNDDAGQIRCRAQERTLRAFVCCGLKVGPLQTANKDKEVRVRSIRPSYRFACPCLIIDKSPPLPVARGAMASVAGQQ
jgi:hypothetical protein